MYPLLIKANTMPPLSVVVDSDASVRTPFPNQSGQDDGENSMTICSKRTMPTKSRRQDKSFIEKAEKPKKSVDFNPKVRVRKITSHRKLSGEERSKVWWSADEFKKIRDSAIATVKKMMKKERVDDDPNDCSRGLEFKTPKKNRIRQARKMDIIWTVLGEQEAQNQWERRAGLIAEIYISCSRSCVEEAAKRGAHDAIVAWS